jgi:hypothetical protein
MPSAWLRRLALVVYAVGVLAYRDAIMDDTYIHLQYARNLRQHGELAFNHGEPSQGASSPLWLLVLAAIGPSETAARLLSVGCGALAVLAGAALARRVVGGAWAAAATLAWAGSLWLVRHAPNGMETAAAALLVLVAVLQHARGGGTRRDLGFGLALAGAFLVRPEAGLLAAVYASAGGRARFAVWMPACVLPVVAWLAFAQSQTGTLLPATASAKSGGIVLDAAVWARVLLRQMKLLGAGQGVEMLVVAAAGLAALRLDGGAVLRRAAHHPLVPYAVFSILLVLVYALFDVQVQPRYLLPVVPCLVLGGCAAGRALLGGGAVPAAVVCAASLALGAAVGAARVWPATRDFARGVHEVLKPMAFEVARRDLPGASVASPDIGVMGFHGGVHVLDLGGLIEPRMQILVDRYGYDAVLERGLFLDLQPVQYVLDRSRERERFRDHVTRGLHWRVLRTATMHGLGISRPQEYHYTLYALEPETALGSRAPLGAGRSRRR